MLPSASGADKDTPPPYLAEVLRFCSGLRYEDLPPAVADRCKRLIADCFAIIAAGNQSDELKAFARSCLAGTQPGHSWVIGTAHRAAARDAGFLNGIAST